MKCSQLEIESLLKDVGAWRTGHFLLTSGLHSNQYMQCQRILQYPRHGVLLADLLAAKVIEAGLRPSVVVGPALGAIHWEVYVAHALDRLSAGEPVRGIFAERPEGKFEIRRGVELQPGEQVLVVEDVTTTGGSVQQVIDLVRKLGAEPVAVGALVDRSGGNAQFGIPFFSLLKLQLETYEIDACPQCKQGIPVDKPGSSKQLQKNS